MKNLRLNEAFQASLGLIALGVSPKPEFGEPGMQARSKSGVPKWTVEVRSRSLNESMRVTVTASTQPDIPEFVPVIFDDLVLGATNTGNFWWAAAGVSKVEAKA